ncbi:NAD(P)-dependent alcohol dehydrogenase [Amaricoccus macauensis]|uniref:NAD(P)-dependent alcohol dehydrogenase n=1 Tax=Amaricoccus macauensis TaxID=57001 RepID=UPI003C7CD175
MTETFKAWSIRRYGGPEELIPVERPLPQPGPGEVLIRIRASAVTRADTMMRAGIPRFARAFLGLGRPRRDLAGTGLSGEVIALGEGVTRFGMGDEVFGETGMNFGGNASHICLDETGTLMPKPPALNHEEAAVMCDGVLTSLNFLREIAEVRAGERVLVLGGSGSLGSAAVQIAKAMGADVTATASARNADLVSSLGSNRVIDYTREDFSRSTARYDVIYDTLGVSSFGEAKGALTPTGRYVCPVLSAGLLAAMLRTARFGRRKARFSATGLQKPEALRTMLAELLAMVEAGTLRPVMDRSFPFDELVAAHRHVETGHKQGNVTLV